MAPTATTTEPEPETQTTAPLPTNDTNGNGHSVTNNGNNGSNKTSYIKPPIAPTGILEKRFRYEDTTPVIGREIFDVNIVDDILGKDGEDTKEEGEELLRDLAVTISRRGVVFFRAQDNLTDSLQKRLVQRLGEVTGKPSTSTLHIHPMLNSTSEFGVPDSEISTISSEHRKKFFNGNGQGEGQQHQQKQLPDTNKGKYEAASWHSDIQFETVPADYTSLRLVELPVTGGDTLWASGYELYERFSKPYQKFLDGLSADFIGDGFLKAAETRGFSLYDQPRGSPENVGLHLSAVHPVVRTNPVTGWKSIYSVGNFPKYIEGLTATESKELLDRFLTIIERNHDLQVRFKWRNKNDLAIWDNRSAFHSATFDYDGLGERKGHRAVGIGERPYHDPASKTRTEALAEEAAARA